MSIKSFTFSSDNPDKVDKSFMNFCNEKVISKEHIIALHSYVLPRDQTSNDVHYLRLIYDNGT